MTDPTLPPVPPLAPPTDLHRISPELAPPPPAAAGAAVPPAPAYQPVPAAPAVYYPEPHGAPAAPAAPVAASVAAPVVLPQQWETPQQWDVPAVPTSYAAPVDLDHGAASDPYVAPTAASVHVTEALAVAEHEQAITPRDLTDVVATRTIGDTSGLAELDARDISAWFGDHKVLDRVSLLMPAGQVTALIGPSGCGKSTFLRILNRMHELIPSASMAGEVILDDQDIYAPERRLTEARRHIGMVFQKPNPFPAMSIYDNVIAGLQLTGTKASSDTKDSLVESCLTKAGLWKEVKDRLRSPGGGLSGGQQQRLCIARSLAVQPRVLLMDEPCSALDPTSTRRIEETILELVSEVTIVIVTHNMQQAARVSDQCAFFLAAAGQPGVIVEHGATAAMFDSPQDQRTYDYVYGRFG